MRRLASIAAAVALFAAVAADGTSNTIMFGAIAQSKLADASLNFKSAGGLSSETELVSGFIVDHPISSTEEAR
jgi:hypothetical protein